MAMSDMPMLTAGGGRGMSTDDGHYRSASDSETQAESRSVG
jgi:hypothetical protein